MSVVNRAILLVDDEPALRIVMRDVLESLDNFDVLEAANGQEALELLQASPTPRLIITDINMPVMNGFRLCARLSTDPVLADVPVVLFSAEPLLTDIAAALHVCGCISKPCDKEEITEVVKRALTQSRRKILLVEDGDDFRSILGIQFERAGFDVVTACDGVEGLALFEANPDAVVVTDGHMPRMGGPELVQRIRNVSPDARIILMTGDPVTEREERTRFHGADFVLMKSGDTCQEVVACLRKLMRHAS